MAVIEEQNFLGSGLSDRWELSQVFLRGRQGLVEDGREIVSECIARDLSRAAQLLDRGCRHRFLCWRWQAACCLSLLRMAAGRQSDFLLQLCEGLGASSCRWRDRRCSPTGSSRTARSPPAARARHRAAQAGRCKVANGSRRDGIASDYLPNRVACRSNTDIVHRVESRRASI